jgi:HTH-type transcriptional regulator / antitoxin HigA
MPNTTPTNGNSHGEFSLEYIGALSVFQFASEYLQPIAYEQQYENVKGLLRSLMLQVPDSAGHPATGLINVLGHLVEQYEVKHYQIPESSPIEIIRHLMEQHDLTQADLPEIGSQGVVSEILSGRRQLNRRQIEAISQRFGISPALFFKCR